MTIYYFQDVIQKLEEFWCKEHKCCKLLSATTEVGAGTLNAFTAMHIFKPGIWNICYVQPSIRPQDGRFGENKNRLYQHHQFQVLLKPNPENIQESYLKSLKYLELNHLSNEIKFLEDDWQNPSIGARGVGWEVWVNGIEISQFTYINQIGGFECPEIAVEVAYGLERMMLMIQKKDNVFELEWNKNTKYKDIFLQNEQDFSHLVHHKLNSKMLLQHFNDYEKMCFTLIDNKNPLAAYDCCLKCTHNLNLLDANKQISHIERINFLSRTRKMTKACVLLMLEIYQYKL